jgi:hypothetical protein
LKVSESGAPLVVISVSSTHLCFEKKYRRWFYSDFTVFGTKGRPGFSIGTVILIFLVALSGALDFMLAELVKI